MRFPCLAVLVLAVSGLFGCERQPVAPIVSSGPQEELVARTAAELEVVARRDQVLATSSGQTQVALAAIEYDVPPEQFGTPTPIDNRLFYAAVKLANGKVSGLFSYTQALGGESFEFSGTITCLNLYDFDGGTHNRVKLGGRILRSNDATIPVGTFIWWQGIDNSLSPGNLPDRSTIAGFGDEAANIAFCTSPAPPRFVFDVDRGNLLVRALGHGALAADAR
jgi:hypothetical protein